MITPQELQTRFTYHPLKPGQSEVYQNIRDKAHELAQLFATVCPESRADRIRHVVFNEGPVQRGQGNGGPSTGKPVIDPKGQGRP
jgi:hypothetical protein